MSSASLTGIPSPDAAGVARAVRIRRWPGLGTAPILLDGGSAAHEPESLDQYVARSGPGIHRRLTLDELVSGCAAVRLSGRGGAGFPLAVKLQAVRDSAADRAEPVRVVANGDEGEPASAKDRYLLAHRPHLVIDGLLLVATALGAERAYLYVSDERLVAPLRKAVAEWASDIPVAVFCVERAYVSGEETSVVRALSGGVAKPTAKPPRPHSHGVDGHPTLVSNVETLAHVARLVRLGADRIAENGTAQEPGTTLLTVVPDVGDAHLVEVPFGVTIREVLRGMGLLTPELSPAAVLTGGFFGGFLPESLWDVAVGHEAMKAAGTGLGCATFLVLTATCPVQAARELLGYFDRENSKQCGVCLNGTAAMFHAIQRICDGAALDSDVANLRRWSAALPGRGACALLDGAARLVSTLLAHFSPEVLRHLDAPCAACREPADPRPETRFHISLPALVGGPA